MADIALGLGFVEGRVQDPLADVFDAPMRKDVALKRGSRSIDTAGVATTLLPDFVTVESGRLGLQMDQAAEMALFSSDFGIDPVEPTLDRGASRDDWLLDISKLWS